MHLSLGRSLTAAAAAANAVTLQDLNMLLSAFTAKPWRQGLTPLFAFIFRTKAAGAYPGHSSFMRSHFPSSGTRSRPAPAPASAVAPSVVGTKASSAKAAAVVSAKGVDSNRVGDRERKASLYGDDSELDAGCVAGEGSVVVTVNVTADSGSGDSNSSASTAL
jgi:hypothetical protein